MFKNIACIVYDTISLYSLWIKCKHIVKDTISLKCDLIEGLFDILEDIFGDDIPESVDKSPVKPFIANIDNIKKDSLVKPMLIFKSRKYNYLKGLYDVRNGKIINPTYVTGDNIDSETKNTIGDEYIIIIG